MSAFEKNSGVLLHIVSLPSEEGIGTLGQEAVAFLDFLRSAKQSHWQILPIHPTVTGDSPFQGPSVFAGNPNLISLQSLVVAGDLQQDDYEAYLDDWRRYASSQYNASDARVEYGFIWERKLGFDSRIADHGKAPLRKAFKGFLTSADTARRESYAEFCRRNADWLDDYALFMALKDSYGFGVLWYRWQHNDLNRVGNYQDDVDQRQVNFFKYIQFVFDEQMCAVRDAAHDRGISLVGDLAIYPGYDSSDVWASKELFQLDGEFRPSVVAAVPPDYFSSSGQLWGNPLYKWGRAGSDEEHRRIYSWWSRRMVRELTYFDTIKIDHFRGFESYGAVDASAGSAENADWIPGPGREAFDAMRREMGRDLPVIAEDLGIITDEVRSLLGEVGFPGMKVFMFADWQTGDPRDNNDHPYLPHNVDKAPHTVYYTGTHDNETLRQKLESGMTDRERSNLEEYVAGSSESELHWKVIDAISRTEAEQVIFPVQDLLYLGAEARMNNPSEGQGWWRWRLTGEQMAALNDQVADRLADIGVKSGRAPGNGSDAAAV